MWRSRFVYVTRQRAGLGIHSFAHRSSLIAHFAQIKWAIVSDSFRSLKTNERLWANRSGRSPKMSYVSESLRSLTKNERPRAIRSGRSQKMSKWVNCSFFWANRSFAYFLQKTSNSLRKPISEFPGLCLIHEFYQPNVWIVRQFCLTIQMFGTAFLVFTKKYFCLNSVSKDT